MQPQLRQPCLRPARPPHRLAFRELLQGNRSGCRRHWQAIRLPYNCEGSVHTYHKIDMREFLEFVIRQLVEFPDDMVLTEIPSGKMTVFKVQLRQSDIGRVIGRNGQTIHAIRALLNSSASRHGQRATLEIIE